MKARLFNYVSGLHSVYQTRKAMTLYNQGLYNTLASSLKTLEEYRRVKIGGYPLVAWLIEEENQDCLGVFLGNVEYKREVMMEGLPNILPKPLHLAYLKGNSRIDEILSKEGFKLVDTDEQERNMLHYAAIYNNVSLIHRAVQEGIEVNCQGTAKSTPLHYAALYGKEDAMRALLSLGATRSLLDDQNRYPLHCSIMSGNLDCFKILAADLGTLEFGEVEHPIHTACLNPNHQILNLILQHQRGSVYRLGQNRMSTLHYAALSGNTKAIYTLISNGALIDQADEFGFTPLHLAVVKDQVQVVKILLSKNADPKIKAENGLDSIESAMLMVDSKVRKVLEKVDMGTNKL